MWYLRPKFLYFAYRPVLYGKAALLYVGTPALGTCCPTDDRWPTYRSHRPRTTQRRCGTRLFQRQSAYRRPCMGGKRGDASAVERLADASTQRKPSLRLSDSARRYRSRHPHLPPQRRNDSPMGHTYSRTTESRLRLPHVAKRETALPGTTARTVAHLPDRLAHGSRSRTAATKERPYHRPAR